MQMRKFFPKNRWPKVLRKGLKKKTAPRTPDVINVQSVLLLDDNVMELIKLFAACLCIRVEILLLPPVPLARRRPPPALDRRRKKERRRKMPEKALS